MRGEAEVSAGLLQLSRLQRRVREVTGIGIVLAEVVDEDLPKVGEFVFASLFTKGAFQSPEVEGIPGRAVEFPARQGLDPWPVSRLPEKIEFVLGIHLAAGAELISIHAAPRDRHAGRAKTGKGKVGGIGRGGAREATPHPPRGHGLSGEGSERACR